MSQKRKIIFIGIIASFLFAFYGLAFGGPDSVYAANCAQTDTAIINCSKNDNGIFSLLLLVINIATAGIGILAIGGIVYASILYATAKDDASQISQAVSIIRNVVIGLVAFALMFSLLQFIIPGGVFNRNFNLPDAEKVDTPRNPSDGDDSGKSPDSPSDPNEKKVEGKFTIGFQNLGYDNVSADNVFQVMKNTLTVQDGNNIYGFAEIDAGDASRSESNALRRVFGSEGWSGANRQVPVISKLNKNWKNVGSEVILLHEATGSNTGPARYLTIAKVQSVESPSTKLAVMSTHFVNKAYNPPIVERLRPYYDLAHQKTSAAASRLHSNGYDVILTGDFNNSNIQFNNIGMRLIARHGPDRIFALPSKGRKMDVTRSGDFFTPSGESYHNALYASFVFSGGGGTGNSGAGSGSNQSGNSQGNNSDNQPSPVKTSDIGSVLNLRDAAASNDVLKPGVLYRSAKLNTLAVPTGANKLSQLLGSSATIIDLRTAAQRAGSPDKAVPNTRTVTFNIEGLLDTEEMVSDPERRRLLGDALRTAANANGSVLVHCIHGKDRTGWMVAMIMYTAGANDSQVMAEYLKSNVAIKGGVRAEWLRSGLQKARAQYGSVEGYLKHGVGLSDGDLKKIIDKFGAENTLS